MSGKVTDKQGDSINVGDDVETPIRGGTHTGQVMVHCHILLGCTVQILRMSISGREDCDE